MNLALYLGEASQRCHRWKEAVMILFRMLIEGILGGGRTSWT